MKPFGLYVHWPFCQAKCPYCDFNSHVTASVDQARWGRALVSEVERYRAETGPRVLSSIFFGGGTPSLMDPRVVAAVIDAALKAWGAAEDIEITLEANPTSTEAGRLAGYRSAGVNRVSLGVQSLDDTDLRRLGRLHTAREALDAIAMARETFDRVSFDLIYARQDQTVGSWVAELRQALDLSPDHLSLYQLTLEPGTAFHERWTRGGLKGIPDEDLGADLWEATQSVCEAAGLPAYEISNHAVPGAESRHNLIYWMNDDWVGVGPGAHGRFTIDRTRIATETEPLPGKWLSLVESSGSGETDRFLVDDFEEAEDALMMGLRLRSGVALDRLSALGNEAFFSNIKELSDIGLMATSGGRLRLTAAGRPILNAVLRRLLDGQSGASVSESRLHNSSS